MDPKEKKISDKPEGVLFQVNVLKSLLNGEYDGIISIRDFLKHGDIGMGTFNAIDGEMIVLDGVVYKAMGNGRVSVASPEEMIPFATVTFMKNDIEVKDFSFKNINELKDRLDVLVREKGRDNFYVVRIDGHCKGVTVRTVEKQEKPYKILEVALPVAKREYAYSEPTGTVVGLYCPSFMSVCNETGWHFHYVTRDKQHGGHLMSVSEFKGDLAVHIFSELEMYCPGENV